MTTRTRGKTTGTVRHTSVRGSTRPTGARVPGAGAGCAATRCSPLAPAARRRSRSARGARSPVGYALAGLVAVLVVWWRAHPPSFDRWAAPRHPLGLAALDGLPRPALGRGCSTMRADPRPPPHRRRPCAPACCGSGRSPRRSTPSPCGWSAARTCRPGPTAPPPSPTRCTPHRVAVTRRRPGVLDRGRRAAQCRSRTSSTPPRIPDTAAEVDLSAARCRGQRVRRPVPAQPARQAPARRRRLRRGQVVAAVEPAARGRADDPRRPAPGVDDRPEGRHRDRPRPGRCSTAGPPPSTTPSTCSPSSATPCSPARQRMRRAAGPPLRDQRRDAVRAADDRRAGHAHRLRRPLRRPRSPAAAGRDPHPGPGRRSRGRRLRAGAHQGRRRRPGAVRHPHLPRRHRRQPRRHGAGRRRPRPRRAGRRDPRRPRPRRHRVRHRHRLPAARSGSAPAASPTPTSTTSSPAAHPAPTRHRRAAARRRATSCPSPAPPHADTDGTGTSKEDAS